MIEARTTVLGDHEYQITQLPAMANMRMLSRICAVLGPVISQIKNINIQRMKAERDVSVVGHVLTALADKLNQAEMESFTLALLETLKVRAAGSDKPFLDCSPKSATFNNFAGRPTTVLRLLAFAVEVNFGDFFEGARTFFGGILAQAKADLAMDPEPPSEASST